MEKQEFEDVLDGFLNKEKKPAFLQRVQMYL